MEEKAPRRVVREEFGGPCVVSGLVGVPPLSNECIRVVRNTSTCMGALESDRERAKRRRAGARRSPFFRSLAPEMHHMRSLIVSCTFYCS